MLLFTSLPLISLVVTAVIASPAKFEKRDTSTSVWNTTTCRNDQLEIVKEWTNMTPSEKDAYIAAEHCLWSLNSTSGLIGATTRFEDLVALHQNMTPIIHAVVSSHCLTYFQSILIQAFGRANSYHTIVFI
jgi:hypothetical protein